ncbi:macrolide family glycosyltransferase [Streptomyces sp. NPDC059788]|uniref:macrolide family glycosyltransferase n=1 Tax=Streptomyces sp. NPDC059788 TaxID=3346948 RepID=UPI003658D14B
MPNRLLFVVLAGHGHVNPTLPLVEELVRRGHRVDYATSAEFADAVTGAGAHWVELPSMRPFATPPEIGPDTVARWLRHAFSALRVTYPVLRAHCVVRPPDHICYDAMNWPARLVAERLGIPAVRTVPNLASNKSYSIAEQLTAGLGPGHPVLDALAADCAEFSAEYGVGIDIDGTLDVTERLNLVFVPRAFQPAADTFDGRFHFLGPAIGRREQAGSWSPPEAGMPVVYVSLGSVFTGSTAFYRTCLDAFADGPWYVAMTVGDLDPAELGPVPPTVELRPRFPQLAVLRHAAAFVTHAGMNSTLEALYHGVGLVAVPHTPEQTANAERAAELGLAETLNGDAVTAEALRSAVTRLTSDAGVRARLDAMRDTVRGCGGAALGADLIEGLR